MNQSNINEINEAQENNEEEPAINQENENYQNGETNNLFLEFSDKDSSESK